MAQCQFCGSRKAIVIDREVEPVKECETRVRDLLEALAQEGETLPETVRLQLVRCPGCLRRYRQLALPILLEESYGKGYLRSGH